MTALTLHEKVSIEILAKIKNLQIKSEIADFDFKELFTVKDSKSKAEFVKDITAFANSKGGYILYGINSDNQWVGLDDRSDEKIDDANLHNILDEYIDGAIRFVYNIHEFDKKEFIIFYIEESSTPIPFKKQGQYSKNLRNGKQQTELVFNKGDIYCRRGSRSIKADNLYFTQKNAHFNIVHNIQNQPQYYTEFVGRKKQLEDLHNIVTHKNTRLIQVDGIGGIGKTALVHYYCSRLIENKIEFKNEFEFIIWMSAKRTKFEPSGIKDLKKFLASYDDVIEEIISFLKRKNILDIDSDLNEEKQVLNFFENNSVLLVIDNMETLLDVELIDFLHNLPFPSKAILTTREYIAHFQMSKLTLHGLDEDTDFKDFIEKEFHRMSQKSFLRLYSNYLGDIYKYTKGMPFAIQLVADQINYNTPMSKVIEGLKSGETIEELLSFCFKGSIDKLSNIQKTILYVCSLPENDEILSEENLIYISGLSSDEIGIDALPNLTKKSLCFSGLDKDGNLGYSIPFLAKSYVKKYVTDINKKNSIINRYEEFLGDKMLISEVSLTDEKFFLQAKADTFSKQSAASKVKNIISIINISGYDTAIGILDSVIADCPNFAYLYFLKGKIEAFSIIDSESEKQARQAYIKASQLDPEYIDAWIELGYLEQKRKAPKSYGGNPLENSKKYFEKALNIDKDNVRANLGYASTLFLISKSISYYHNKQDKLSIAKKANAYFEKAYHHSESNLPKAQQHLNAINAHTHALNLYLNLRDYEGSIRVCETGLKYEPYNEKLQNLKKQAKDKMNPISFEEKLKEKGWL